MNTAKSHARVVAGHVGKMSLAVSSVASCRQYAPVPHCSSSATDTNAKPQWLCFGNAMAWNDKPEPVRRSSIARDQSPAAVAFKTLIPDASLVTRDGVAAVKIVGANLYTGPLYRHTMYDNMMRDAANASMKYIAECQDTFRAVGDFECTVTLKVRMTPDVIYWIDDANSALRCNVLVRAELCQA